MKRTWQYLINPFLTASANSFRIAKKIGDFTLAALKARMADPFFLALYNLLLPLMNDFTAKYTNWLKVIGTQMSETSTLITLLADLRGIKIDDWERDVENIYHHNTPKYIAIFPHHRVPFQTGSQEDRISAVDALSQALAGDLALAAIKADVDAFLLLLNNAFSSQKGKISGTKTASDDTETSRVTMCEMLYNILSQCITHFFRNPILAAPLFDLETIRNHVQVTFRHAIKGGEVLLVMEHTFVLDEMVRIVNRGNTDLKFWLAAEANDPIGLTFVLVTANNEVVIPASQMGALTNRFMKCMNVSGTEDGGYLVVLE